MGRTTATGQRTTSHSGPSSPPTSSSGFSAAAGAASLAALEKLFQAPKKPKPKNFLTCFFFSLNFSIILLHNTQNNIKLVKVKLIVIILEFYFVSFFYLKNLTIYK